MLHVLPDVAHEIAGSDPLFGDRLIAELCEGQQVIEELRHVLGITGNALQVTLSFAIQMGSMLIEDDVCEAVDRPQRRT